MTDRGHSGEGLAGSDADETVAHAPAGVGVRQSCHPEPGEGGSPLAHMMSMCHPSHSSRCSGLRDGRPSTPSPVHRFNFRGTEAASISVSKHQEMRVGGASPTGAPSPRVPGRPTLAEQGSLVGAWMLTPLVCAAGRARDLPGGRPCRRDVGAPWAFASGPGPAGSVLSHPAWHEASWEELGAGDTLPPLRGPRAPGAPSHAGAGHGSRPRLDPG